VPETLRQAIDATTAAALRARGSFKWTAPGPAGFGAAVAEMDFGASRGLLAALLHRQLPQVRYRPPDGTYLAWLDCAAMDLPGSPGALVTERGQVTVVDGPAFGDGGPGAFRLNFATPQPVLAEIVERIAAALGEGR